MFNIYFNRKLDCDQVFVGKEADILKADFDYAILIADEQTMQLMQRPEFKQLMGRYELKQKEAVHPSGRGAVPLILLKKR